MDFLLRDCEPPAAWASASSDACGFVHRADEADALARDGADQALLFAAVADRLARGVDAAGQRGVRNDPAAPDRGDQIVLADHAVAVLHQIDQQVEHLRLERDQIGAAPQLAPVGIKYMIFKVKLHVACPRVTGLIKQ